MKLASCPFTGRVLYDYDLFSPSLQSPIYKNNHKAFVEFADVKMKLFL